MNLKPLEKIALSSALTESEVFDIIGKASESRAELLLNEHVKDTLRSRQERAMNESREDAEAMVDTIQALARKSFLTEAQLARIVDKNDHLNFSEINESTLVELVRKELDQFGTEDLKESRTRRFKNSLNESNGSKALNNSEPRRLFENESNNIQVGDINTILFGEDDKIELPVGYTHVAVDFDGTVNAYTSKPVFGKEGWEGEGIARIGRVTWDDVKLSGSNDKNVLDNERCNKMRASLVQVHDQINLGDNFAKMNAYSNWKSDYMTAQEVVNESTTPAVNRFLAVPAHLL